jgi:magnesium-transporting ATPase (P-type)
MAANIDPLSVSDYSPVAETNAKNAPRSAPNPELTSKLGSAKSEPRQGETRTSLSATGTAAVNSGNAPEVISKGGLTSDAARRQLAKFGPNAMPDTSAHPLRMALEKFWAPVPWMLEAAVVLELVLGKYVEAAIIAFSWYSTPRSDSSRKVAPRRR